ncbi:MULTISPECIES: NADH:flavin oxidoreductase/NADH oxidase [Actinoplanes]|uniref:NADH:flavin oxidoreductase/NADH oxidase n=1 Tax=Actinoplanes TaxID=1865 RepID=UPI0005F290E7|nr:MULTISPECIES: NADH:flavin oxidoreductase/NADH oxidase [Actinoplanes]GLY03929.1 oxidoreductase [Actinoplanes sp. NBRC 101535]
MTSLFEPITLRGLTIPNRVWMSPMCTYSATGGHPEDFHLAHYAARAAGGAGLVMVEATGVLADGRISPFDLGIWDDEHVASFARIAAAITAGGAVPAIQLAHAGRKASIGKPWLGGKPVAHADGGWDTLAPSATAFPGYPEPAAMTEKQIAGVVEAFAQAARRAHDAGFQVAEVHAAHGYLLHEFLSPLSNTRDDQYGGSLANRARLLLEVIDVVRAAWPADRPVLLRVSTTDWTEGGWTVEDTIQVTRWAREHGVDLVDASSGGLVPATIPDTRDYQTSIAARLRAEAGDVPVGAVGRITDAAWADELITTGQADVVLLGRALLDDPSWPNRAARELGAQPRFLEQYAYAVPR